MPRPPRCRRICGAPQVDTFCPNGCEDTEPILLTLDEYEVIRLVDLEQQTHEQCAAQMDISRSTVQEICESARRKIAACLVHGKPLHITGGNYRICGGQLTYINNQIGAQVAEGSQIAVISDLSHFKVEGEIADTYGDRPAAWRTADG